MFKFGGVHFCWYFDDKLLTIEYYCEEINTVLESTTREVLFLKCSFSSAELQSLFSHAKHIKRLRFDYCRLGVDDEFDIKEQHYNLKYLVLWYCETYSGWEDNLDKFKILVKAIANSSLKKSLKKIGIFTISEKLDEEKVEEIFERHGIQDLLI